MKTNAEEGKIETAQNKHEVTENAQSSFGSRWVASCKKLLAQMESVKAAVVSEFRGRLEEHDRMVELAVNEAEALAWETGFPQLLFPDLAVEKAYAVAGWHERQQALRRRSAQLITA